MKRKHEILKRFSTITLGIVIAILTVYYLIGNFYSFKEVEKINSNKQYIPIKDDSLRINYGREEKRIDKLPNNRTPIKKISKGSIDKVNKIGESEAIAEMRVSAEIKEERESLVREIDLKAKIKNLVSKAFALHSNRTMFVQKKYEVIGEISDDDIKETIVNRVIESKRELIFADNIKSSYKMSMLLNGVNFDIEEQSQRIQLIQEDSGTEWKWSVTPLESGVQELELKIYAHLNLDNESTPYEVEVFNRLVKVRIGFFNGIILMIKNNWEWIIALSGIPIWGVINRKLKKRKTKSQ